MKRRRRGSRARPCFQHSTILPILPRRRWWQRKHFAPKPPQRPGFHPALPSPSVTNLRIQKPAPSPFRRLAARTTKPAPPFEIAVADITICYRDFQVRQHRPRRPHLLVAGEIPFCPHVSITPTADSFLPCRRLQRRLDPTIKTDLKVPPTCYSRRQQNRQRPDLPKLDPFASSS